jgi:MinD superfamily P-loop ATPase
MRHVRRAARCGRESSRHDVERFVGETAPAPPPHIKKDMCISCGNCSTYCEMGIDVRAYAMANLDVKRAACVGCGCAPTSARVAC